MRTRPSAVLTARHAEATAPALRQSLPCMSASAAQGVSAVGSTLRSPPTNVRAFRASMSTMNIDHPFPFEHTSMRLLVIVPSAISITVTLHSGSVSHRSVVLNTKEHTPLVRYYIVQLTRER